ncbi:MAG: hypothetical protein KatS3mg059_1347 [Thermomicrobiales bacterium]|nr:MAG: hypothetical protein KatS3mg059_1347 [Thermomicrobiales bacterium]
MESQDVERKAGTSGMPKEFLALTHGQEWVAFYESFDKLVQDHLQRSSELLRRAMALPEVADREVAQVRAEMEAKLAAERERSRELLTQLREELVASQRQVSILSESVNSLIADLERLSARLGDSLMTYGEPGPAPAPEEAAPAAQSAEPAPASQEASFAAAVTDTAEAPAPTDEVLSVAQPVAMDEAAVNSEPASSAPEPPGINGLAGPGAAAQPAEVDLASLAASESGTPANESAPVASQAPAPGTGYFGSDQSDRPRPHWLSVTRLGTRQ